LNNINLIGRLGRDPESRFTGGGKQVVNFSIAVDYGFGEKKTTSWIPITCWEKTAELAAKYLVKGSQVAVSGRLQERSWQDKEGNKRTVLEVIVNQLDFISKAEKRSQSEQNEFDGPQVADEDIPF
jgi:single-strand DNA-binding protein